MSCDAQSHIVSKRLQRPALVLIIGQNALRINISLERIRWTEIPIPLRNRSGIGHMGNGSVAGILDQLGPDVLIDLALRDREQIVVLGDGVALVHISVLLHAVEYKT